MVLRQNSIAALASVIPATHHCLIVTGPAFSEHPWPQSDVADSRKVIGLDHVVAMIEGGCAFAAVHE
jgi:hypothetical protein